VKRSKFKDRYVLATGYPWAVGSELNPIDIRMVRGPMGVVPIQLKWPKELWEPSLPRYRLVLEKVNHGKAK
jgi:hypothetical protein